MDTIFLPGFKAYLVSGVGVGIVDDIHGFCGPVPSIDLQEVYRTLAEVHQGAYRWSHMDIIRHVQNL